MSELNYKVDEIKEANRKCSYNKRDRNEFEAGGISSALFFVRIEIMMSSRVFEYIEAQPEIRNFYYSTITSDDATWSENMCWLMM